MIERMIFIRRGQAARAVAGVMFSALVLASGLSAPAVGQDRATAPPQAWSRNFGNAGLLAKFNSSEAYGAVQSRTGLYRSHVSYSQATGVTVGFKDDVRAIVAPINATIPLSGINPKAWLKLGAALISTQAAKGNLTRVDNNSISLAAQVLYPFTDNMIAGVGPAADRGTTDFRHNGGDTKTSGSGIRFDYMHIAGPNVGVTARALYLTGKARTTIPIKIGPVKNSRPLDRLYLETNLIGSYRKADIDLVPDGWVFRPTLAATVQLNSLGDTVDNLGKTYPHANERYVAAALTARLEKGAFGPGLISPYAEIGEEHELINNLDAVDSEPDNFYYKVGAATTFTGRERIDLYFAGRDGLKGRFHSGTINILVSLSL